MTGQKGMVMTMKLVKSLLTKNPCYTAGKKITVKGLMLHSVGCPQPRASVFIGNWNQESFDDACVHAFIDGNDGTVYQTLPWDHRGWHCASGKKGSGNNTHIGVEMCEPDCIKYVGGSTCVCLDVEAARAVVKRTYEAAMELFAYLCGKYGLDPLADGVVISHKEGYTRGIASNHGDPEHLWRQLGLEYTMDGFRRDVKAAVGAGGSGECREEEQKEDVECKKLIYRVRVGIKNLNIRKGPGTNYGKNGRYTGEGIFTIIEVKAGKGAEKGWGRLKSKRNLSSVIFEPFCSV